MSIAEKENQNMKRTLGVLAALLIMLAVVPAAVNAAEVTEYPLWVGNVHVTSEVSSGTGWKFEASASGGTLTLEDAKITDAAFTVDSYFTANIGVSGGADFDLVVELKGNNTLSGANYGIYLDSISSLEIHGPGSLKVIGEDKAVFSWGRSGTEIKGAEIHASVSSTGIYALGLIITDSVITSEGESCGIDCSALTISNSYVSADGEDIAGIRCGELTVSGDSYLKANCKAYGAVFFGDVDLNKDLEIWEPCGGELRYDEEYGRYRAYNDENKVADTLIIGKEYPLWIGSGQVTTENMRDLTAIKGVNAAEGGSVSYDPKTGTLTLDKAKVTGVHAISDDDDWGFRNISFTGDKLTIVLEGENKLESEEAYCSVLGINSLITFEGDGSLEVDGLYYGLYSYLGGITVESGELTVSGGNIGIVCQYEKNADGVAPDKCVLTVNGGSVKTAGHYGEGIFSWNIVFNGGYVESEALNEFTGDDEIPFSAISYVSMIKFGERARMVFPVNWEFRKDEQLEVNHLWNRTDTDSQVPAKKCVIKQLGLITFKNEGETLSEDLVLFGDIPTVNLEKEPEKEPDQQYTYGFAGWRDQQGIEYPKDADLPAVTGDEIYIAFFTPTVNEYTVKFLDEDGTELQSGKVAYGETPEYKGTGPSKNETEKYTYTFSGWTPAITKVTGDAAYTAVFNATEKDPVYIVKDGTDGSWTKGSGNSFSITVKRSFDDDECFSHFSGVSIDGKVLDKNAYKAEKGSTVVTISAETLDALSEGNHTVTVEFDDGKAETTLTVKAADTEEDKTPDTDDIEHPWILAWISALSLISLGAVLTLRKRSLG